MIKNCNKEFYFIELAKLNLLDDNSDLTFFIHSFQAKQKETSCI